MDISSLIKGGPKKKEAPKKNPPTANDSSQAEDDVLAALGTTRAETSSYESDILRQATHKLAPNLKVDSDDKFLGFPDFITETSLLPFSSQKQGKANRQVVMKVLAKVQAQILNGDTGGDLEAMRLLAMKQNVLLSMLGQNSKKPAIQQLWKHQQATEEVYKACEEQQQGRKRISMMQRKQIPGTSSLAKAQQLTHSRKKKKVWKDWSSDEEDEGPTTRPVLTEMNYSRRRLGTGKLTRKQSTTKSRLRGAPKRKARKPQHSVATAMTSRARRNRTPVASYAETGKDDDDVTVPDEVDSEVKKEQMEFDLRNPERNNRPRRSSRAQVTSYAEADDDNDEDTEEESFKARDPVAEPIASSTEIGVQSDDINISTREADEENNNIATELNHQVAVGSNNNGQIAPDEAPSNSIDDSEAATETTHASAAENSSSSTITCPLCQSDLTITDDTQLAQHMAECQEQQSSSRRSRRRRTAPSKGYSEVDDPMQEEEEELTTTKPPGRKRKHASVKSKENDKKNELSTTSAASSDGEEDDQFEFDADEPAEEDEDLEAEPEDVEMGDVPLEKPTALDDYLLDDYEDRVDYWRLHGVSEMRDMSKLRAEGETDPGAVTLEGGLTIPAWMNNRLFGYQRTGLEWMWTLHQQQAGGVMGDEMGLG